LLNQPKKSPCNQQLLGLSRTGNTLWNKMAISTKELFYPNIYPVWDEPK
jgi:hypothetical protein